jgi:hypothetical protein
MRDDDMISRQHKQSPSKQLDKSNLSHKTKLKYFVRILTAIFVVLVLNIVKSPIIGGHMLAPEGVEDRVPSFGTTATVSPPTSPPTSPRAGGPTSPIPETPLFKSPLSCIWSPNSNGTKCLNLLSSLVCNSKSEKALGRRLLILGDSTMGTHYLSKHVKNFNKTSVCRYKYEYDCKQLHSERCRNNGLFGFQYSKNDTWQKTDFLNKSEGPVAYGLQHHFCSDCVRIRLPPACTPIEVRLTVFFFCPIP